MTSREIITSFKQGGTGNCVSIAVIKASIQVFGIGQVVFFTENGQGGYSFLMRDGFEGEVSKDELDIAIKGSRFQLLGNKEMFDYANLCFSAMVKRALWDHHEESLTYNQAVDSLNNGENYYLGADWLGLRHHKRPIGLKYVWKYIGVVGASAKHCFFCSEGLVDHYGKPDPINFIERLIEYRFFSYYRIALDANY